MSSIAVRLGNYGVYDPTAAIEAAERLGVTVDLGLANSYTCPRGREPGVAELLLVAGDLDRIRAADAQILTLEGDSSTVHVLLWMESARSVFPGDDGNPDELFVVRFLDRRCRLAMRPCVEFARNVRAPDRPDEYVAATVNAGAAYSWEAICQHAWNQLNSGTLATDGLGTWPGWPAGFTPPAALPENLQWRGVPWWDVLNDLLDRLGLAVCYDPTAEPSGTVYRLAMIGQDDASHAAIERVAFPIDDLRYRRGVQQSVPARVIVAFPKQSALVTDLAADSLHEVEAGSDAVLQSYGFTPSDVDSASRVVLFDDLTARIGADGDPENDSDLTARADERAAEFYRRLSNDNDWPPGRMKVFSGIERFRPGGRIERVTWAFEPGSGWTTRYSASYTGEPRRFMPSPMSAGATARLVKVIDEGNFPHAGAYKVFACRTLVPVFDEEEGAAFDMADFLDGDVIYAGAFKNASPSRTSHYIAHAVGGRWLFDPCDPCVQYQPPAACPCTSQTCFAATFAGTVVDEDSTYAVDLHAEYIDETYVLQIDPTILAGGNGSGYCQWSNEFHADHDTDYDVSITGAVIRRSCYLNVARTGAGDIHYLHLTVLGADTSLPSQFTFFTATGRYELNGEFDCNAVNTFTFVREEFASEHPANTQWAEEWPETVTVYPVDCDEAYAEPGLCGAGCNGERPATVSLCLYGCNATAYTITLTCQTTGMSIGKWTGSATINPDWRPGGVGYAVSATLECVSGDAYKLTINGEDATAYLASANPMLLYYMGEFPTLNGYAASNCSPAGSQVLVAVTTGSGGC